MRFVDRTDAGRRLGKRLLSWLEDERAGAAAGDLVVLGLPRGGVPVAFEVAQALSAPLDVMLVHKLGVPFQPEFAMGAVGDTGPRVVDEHTVRWAGVSPERLDEIERETRAELVARAARFRQGRPPLALAGRTVILVDDGAATGLTALAACQLAHAAGARRVIVAVPVASREAVAALGREADAVIALSVPPDFFAVGAWFEDFRQTSEAEVLECLRRAQRPEAGSTPSDVLPADGTPHPGASPGGPPPTDPSLRRG